MMAPALRQRGLTLIELMIGLGICAVLMSLAVPSFASYLQRQRLKAAAQGLELDLREARYESARRGAALNLVFMPGPDWCYAIASTPECDCHLQQPCRIKTVRAQDLRGVHLSDTHATRFDPASGNVDQPGTIAVWQAPGGEKVRVSVSPLGRPFACMTEGNLPPLPTC